MIMAASMTNSTASAAGYPVNWNAPAANAYGAFNDVPPAGANNWSCKPSAAHPRAVVLVHGILQNQNMAWEALAPILANNGYCVYALSYGQVWYGGNLGGIDDVYNSAQYLGSFVSQVLSSTRTSTVDIVGYSEGGNIIRNYIKNYGGRTKIHTYLGIAGVNMGPPSLYGIQQFLSYIPGAYWVWSFGCPACSQLSDPNYFSTLNNPATYSNIAYVTIASSNDEVLGSTWVASLPAAGNVKNYVIQDFCPNDHVGHLGMTYDQTAIEGVEITLDPTHPVRLDCGSGFPE
jgi:pimeloyl-ACP methyl ester carboxylesterase